MSVEIQIIEHKDCIRCFQPIDDRANVCPFCQSEQTVPRKWPRLVLPLLVLLALACLSWFWFQSRELEVSKVGLERELSATQEELAETLDDMRMLELTQKAELQAVLTTAEAELDGLIRRAALYSSQTADFCGDSRILQTCSDIDAASAKDSISLAKLLGTYQAFDRQTEFCDRLRPVLLRLGRGFETELGRALHTRYFLGTESCWHSGR